MSGDGTHRGHPGLQDAMMKLFGTPQGRTTSLISLPGGSRLFSEGDESDHLYLLRTGRLGVYRHTESTGEISLIGIVKPGEPVGEMSLIAGKPHTATVIALRDSELLAMPREDFLRAADTNADLLLALSRKVIERAQDHAPVNTPSVFAFYALCDKPIRPFVEAVAEAVKALGSRVCVVDKSVHGNAIETLMAVEASHDVVLHVAERHESHWRLLSSRQVDHCFMVADPGLAPTGEPLPAEIPALQRSADLVLLYAKGARVASIAGRTRAWLEAVQPARWFHMTEGLSADVARMARILTGQSVGVVFSGGGARAFAQIGAIQALREARVPVDFVCGSSMGGVLGAPLALGLAQDEIDERIRDAFVNSSPLDDVSFPLLAMSSGRKVEARLRKHFGEQQIEDIPLPYFCVSSNLTSGQIKIHRTGLLRTALRASISLPGVLPPVVEDGQVLVDGGVMRSFPAGLMRSTHLGTVIGIDVTRARGLDPSSLTIPDNLMTWLGRGDWRRGPPIVSVLMRSATVTTAADLAHARAATDLLIIPEPDGVEIRDWHAYEEAVENGYKTAVETLAQLDCPITQMRRLGRSIQPNIPAFIPDDSHLSPPPARKVAKVKPPRINPSDRPDAS